MAQPMDHGGRQGIRFEVHKLQEPSALRSPLQGLPPPLGPCLRRVALARGWFPLRAVCGGGSSAPTSRRRQKVPCADHGLLNLFLGRFLLPPVGHPGVERAARDTAVEAPVRVVAATLGTLGMDRLRTSEAFPFAVPLEGRRAYAGQGSPPGRCRI